jgi:hypothetical protein
MSEQTTTALTAKQVAEFHDQIEEQQDDILAGAVDSWRSLARPLPRCFACRVTPTEIRMEIPEEADELVVLRFDACGHSFHADQDVIAAGLRIHNARRQA